MTTIRVYTAPGTNASRIGDAYAHWDGVTWRDSADRCDSDGGGRVFLDCESESIAALLKDVLVTDERVQSFRVD